MSEELKAKVIKGMKSCQHMLTDSGESYCGECPYNDPIMNHTCDNPVYCIKDYVRDALKLLSNDNWISVKDRLPDAAGYECLVYAINENTNQPHIFTAHTGYGEPGWWTGNVHYMAKTKNPSDNSLHSALKVTHWMPLPEPPKEESGEL